MSGRRGRWVVAITIFIQTTLVLSMVFCGIESLIPDDTVAARFHAWVGLVGGTFPDLERYNIERMTYWFALALTIKFYLLALPILGIVALSVSSSHIGHCCSILSNSDNGKEAAYAVDRSFRDPRRSN